MLSTQIQRLKKDIKDLEFYERKLIKRGNETKAINIKQKRQWLIDSLEDLEIATAN